MVVSLHLSFAMLASYLLSLIVIALWLLGYSCASEFLMQVAKQSHPVITCQRNEWVVKYTNKMELLGKRGLIWKEGIGR